MTRIHPTALVDPGAELGEGVEIGPFAQIGAHVVIGARTVIGSHTIVDGLTTLGEDNRIGGFCVLGGPPQDKKYAGEPTRLEIGDRNTVREYCYFNTGTVQDAGVTRVGHDNWIMGYVHVAHDCQLGNHLTLANAVQLAGHVHLGDWVILGGLVGVHQFVKVGAHAMAGAHSYLSQDLPPYVMAQGAPATAHGLNSEGLRRRGFAAEAIAELKAAYRTLYRSGLTLAEARTRIGAQVDTHAPGHEAVAVLARFLDAAERGIVR